MRASDDLPPRRPRRTATSGRRWRILLIVGLVALFVLLTSMRGIAGFYTDYLWFDSLGQWGVRRGILGAQLSLAFIFILAFFVLAWSNLYVAEMVAPPFRPSGPEDELLERYHDLVAGRMGRVRLVVAGLLAVIAGSGASAEWNSWVLFTNGGDFGVEDPQFHRDVGFYVFRLPFLSFVVDWLFASLLIVLIVTAVAHYLNGGIRVQPPAPRVSAQVKAHLSVLLAALSLVKTADYWLQRFELTSSSRGVVDGASYTDVNAQLPALNLLLLISLAAAALFVANIFRRGWTLPVVAVVLWGFVAVVVGGIYPQVVQRLRVQPEEFAREEPYLERNIEATRRAMGVDEVQVEDFEPVDDPGQVDLMDDESTVRNIRLWDPAAEVSGQAFGQLQQVRPYYSINDVDVDRYEIGGLPTQVNLGIRDLDPSGVPGDSWESQHLAYTHGYGLALAPSNATADSEPQFDVRDIPVTSSEGAPVVERPGIYFGENVGGYAVVNTDRREIDFEAEEGEAEDTSYRGEDGVEVGSPLRRAAFALRFGDLNPLISGYLDNESRVIFHRDVVERVETLAPFMHVDGDPYPVILESGEVRWVVDLYTTTSRYPYAQRVDTEGLGEESGLDHRFNYVRNSVKATVDAYDGTVRFYVMDDRDPIVEAYRDAFPELFSDAEDMPDEMEAHLRYPEDLFRVQTNTWQRYHLTDPQEFFDQDDLWRVAPDPGTPGAGEATSVTDERGQATGESREARLPPYYQLLRLPGQEQAEFVMMRPFVPASGGDERGQLAAFMAARMDPGNYGELVVYDMPDGNLPDGPALVANTMRSTDAISETESLQGRAGSTVRYGNMLLVPVDNAPLYVVPFYVEETSATRAVPQLRYVIAVLGERAVIDETLQGALEQLFGEVPGTQEEQPSPTEQEPTDPTGGEQPGEEPGGVPTDGTTAEQAAALLDQARQLFEDANTALQEGNLAEYEENVEAAQDRVNQALELLGGAPAGADGGGSQGGRSEQASSSRPSAGSGAGDDGTTSTTGRSPPSSTTTTRSGDPPDQPQPA
jgi:uncharacterized protein